MSGSHGTEDGRSGLTDKNLIYYVFYKEDCELLGIKPGPEKRSQRLPLRNWNGVPDITKPAEKVGNQDSLLQDMDVRVCNIAYYYSDMMYDNSQKLIEDILKEIICTLNFKYSYVFHSR